jgi:hypothetical protein
MAERPGARHPGLALQIRPPGGRGGPHRAQHLQERRIVLQSVLFSATKIREEPDQ